MLTEASQPFSPTLFSSLAGLNLAETGRFVRSNHNEKTANFTQVTNNA